MTLLFRLLFCILLLILIRCPAAARKKRREKSYKKDQEKISEDNEESGYNMYQQSFTLLRKGDILGSRKLLRNALMRSDLINQKGPEEVFDTVIRQYTEAGQVCTGYLMVAEVYKKILNKAQARGLVDIALASDPTCAEAYVLKSELVDHDVDLYKMIMEMHGDLQLALKLEPNDPNILKRIAALYSNALIWVCMRNVL